MAEHRRIGWTTIPVVDANTNRDGSGTVYRIIKITDTSETIEGQYVDNVTCSSFGTNIATEGVILGTNGNSLSDKKNNFLIDNKPFSGTTAGTAVDTDIIKFQIGAWFPKGYELYALVHDAQAAGRQFVAYSSPTYQEF